MYSEEKYYLSFEQEKTREVVSEQILLRMNKILESNNINERTKNFLQSIKESYLKQNGLTAKQFRAFEKVEDYFFTNQAYPLQGWVKQYDEEKKRRVRICALYYKSNPPYFMQLASKILEDKEFIPTEAQYNSICKNKFALKVIKAYEALALYNVGSMVKFRKFYNDKSLADKMAAVIEVNADPIVSAAKGSKVYRVLPVGEKNIIKVEERFLKKIKKSV